MVGCESKGAGRSHSGLRGFFPLLLGSAASLFCAAICIESVIASLFCVAIYLLFLLLSYILQDKLQTATPLTRRQIRRFVKSGARSNYVECQEYTGLKSSAFTTGIAGNGL